MSDKLINIFQNPLALALGILCGYHVDNLLKNPWVNRSLSSTDDIGWNRHSLDASVYGTGRGGWYYDPCGDKGKPTDADKHSGGSEGVPGSGGTLNSGGSGLFKGTRKQGGGFNTSSTANHYGTCAGAGGGLYGGGAGFLLGGSGGGSSLAPAAKPYCDNPAYYDKTNEPDGIKEVVHYDKDTLHFDIHGYGNQDLLDNMEGLINLNCSFPWYYQYICKYMNEYKDYDKFVDLFTQAQGNGFIIISKKNRHIHFKHIRVPIIGTEIKWKWLGYGALKNIGQILYEKDGSVQSFTLDPGKYEVLLYGAMGGSTGVWSQINDSYCGGFGGMELCTIEVTKKVKLYAYLGQHGSGKASYNPFNGGGACGPGCTSGGGSTDIRFSNADYYDSWFDRIAVAGGGGGIWGGTSSGGTDYTLGGGSTTHSLNASYSNPETLFVRKYPVNNSTKVKVEFDIQVSPEMESPADIHMKIKLADGNEGELEQTFTVNSSGHVIFEYLLDETYEVDTPTHNVSIEAEYWVSENGSNEPTDEMIAATSKILISVETVTNNEDDMSVSPSTVYLNCSDKINLTDEVEFIGRTLNDQNIEVDDFIDLFEQAVTELKESGEIGDLETGDWINLVDSILIELKGSNKLSIEAFDTFEITDDTDYISQVVYDVNAIVDPEYPGGSITGTGRYNEGTTASLAAIFAGDYIVEWYENDTLIYTGEVLEFIVDRQYSLTVRFKSKSPVIDLPFVTDCLALRFDAILNYNGNHADSHFWTDFRRKATVSKDSLGFSDDAYLARFDAINNTSSGHDTSSFNWVDIHE